MNPQFPLYIVSKGRADTRQTAKALTMMRVPFNIVVEEQERAAYEAVIDREFGTVLVLDPKFQREYETCDPEGDAAGKGPGAGAARNFAWAHAIAGGHAWHWVMDDNIRLFFRLDRNLLIPVADGTCFRVMEDFCLRYTNVVMAGPQYAMFAPKRMRMAPFVVNTRIYSCNLIRNDILYRWRGRLNEDTILSLDILKAGWCTIQFNAFLQNKATTQTVRGGNMSEFYAKEGTKPKSLILMNVHGDVAELKWRYGRCHHYVNYKQFRTKLHRRDDIVITPGVNEYGMKLVQNVPDEKLTETRGQRKRVAGDRKAKR